MDKLPGFDQLLLMSPEELTDLQLRMSQSVIESADPENRVHLESLNFHIRLQIERARNPVDAMVKMSELMHEKFRHMNVLLQSFCYGREYKPRKAEVIRVVASTI